MAAEVGIVNKSGAWYSYKEAKIGQGRENAKQFLAENPEIFEEIYEQVRESFGIKSAIKYVEGIETEK